MSSDEPLTKLGHDWHFVETCVAHAASAIGGIVGVILTHSSPASVVQVIGIWVGAHTVIHSGHAAVTGVQSASVNFPVPPHLAPTQPSGGAVTPTSVIAPPALPAPTPPPGPVQSNSGAAPPHA